MLASGTIAQVRIGRVAPLDGSGTPTAFRKQPAAGAVAVHWLGLAGDEVGNRRVHGGPDKAIYAYPSAGYAPWAADMPALAARFVAGAMGENLVVDGLDEASVHLGDVIRAGTATLQVAQIREPCSVLAAAYASKAVVRRMTASGRCGWYCRVLEEGAIAAGDAHSIIERPCPDWPISRFTPIAAGGGSPEELAELARLPVLTAAWRERLSRRLGPAGGTV
jgi:MOSC domain-containing protein YiiM